MLGLAGPGFWALSCQKGGYRFGMLISICRSENVYLSRGVTTRLPHLYPGHSAGQAQDRHHEPGQGELRVVVGTSGG